jgi:CrcB protein
MTDPNSKLPLDESSEDCSRRTRPAHLSGISIGLVAVGGAIGTGLRYLIGTVVPYVAQVPVATLGINVVGAFLLGVLLEFLADHRLDTGWSRQIRLGAGTGVLGGFTTYSTLAVDTAVLASAHPIRAAGYAVATVLLGAAASIAGIWLSRGQLRPTVANRMARS